MSIIIRSVPENFQEGFCNIVFSSSSANYSLLPRMILEIWKILEITSVGISFLYKWLLKGSLKNSCSKQLSGEDSAIDLLPANFQKLS